MRREIQRRALKVEPNPQFAQAMKNESKGDAIYQVAISNFTGDAQFNLSRSQDSANLASTCHFCRKSANLSSEMDFARSVERESVLQPKLLTHKCIELHRYELEISCSSSFPSLKSRISSHRFGEYQHNFGGSQ